MQHIYPSEQWRDIPGYEGWYQVSDHGRARSVDRVVTKANGVEQPWKGQILAPRYGQDGKIRLWLRGEDRRFRSVLLHRAVLEAFIGPRSDGMEACHWDDDPQNNYLYNLRWASRSENMKDRVRNGRDPNARKTHCKQGHEFTPENTGPGHGGTVRRCRACNREKTREYRAKRAAA